MEKEKQIWTVVPPGNGPSEFTSKRAAYRRCRVLNGKKVGGNRSHHVQRKNVRGSK